MDSNDAQKAVQYLIDSAPDFAFSKATQVKCENMLRVVKSLTMKASNEKTSAAKETQAYASQPYLEAVQELFEATVKAEEIKALREAAKYKIEVWRSLNAGARNAERGYGSHG